MGCCTKGQEHVLSPVRLKSNIGTLNLTVLNANLFRKVSIFKMDPYLTLKVSDYTFTTKVNEDGDVKPQFNETFSMLINSCYKAYGRQLSLTVIDKNDIGSDKEIGFGIVDLDPVINQKKKSDLRCFLSHNNQQAGIVRISCQFIQEPFQQLNLRFLTAVFPQKLLKTCWVRVVIGEESLMTSKSMERQETSLDWSSDVLVFSVPRSARVGQVLVYGNQMVVGTLELTIQKLMQKNSQSFTTNFGLKEINNVGTLSFQVQIGHNPQFPQPKSADPPKPLESKPAEPMKTAEPTKPSESAKPTEPSGSGLEGK